MDYVNMLIMLFHEKLKLALNQRDISQKTLAKRTKISLAAISRYLSGERVPTALNLIQIADAMNIAYGEIMAWLKDGMPNLKPESIDERMLGLFKEMGEYEKKDHVDALEFRMKKGDSKNGKKTRKAVQSPN